MTDLEQQLTEHLRRRAAAAIPRYDLEGIEQAIPRPVSLVDLDDHRARHPKSRMIVGLVGAAAAAAAVIAIAVVTIPSDEPTVSTSSDQSTVSTSARAGGGGPAFAAAIEASGVLTSPSADEVTQARGGFYQTGGPAAASAAGHKVSLWSCRSETSAPCNSWAYLTRTADGDGHAGLLGTASPPLALQPLDDRYFVASAIVSQAQAPSKAWVIDAVSGKVGPLSWRNEPTTMNTPEQALLLVNYSNEAGLPKVVDARDGTIRPLAMPDDVVAGPTQHDGSRVWVGTNGQGPGLAYSDDGATWRDVALPEEVRASVDPDSDDLDLLIAADGDRVAVTSGWVPDGMSVHVSHDAGRSWTAPTAVADTGLANIAHLYVLTDGRLALQWNIDAHPKELFVSTGTDWTELNRADRKNWSTIKSLIARGR
jgi:hypothetical protein